MRSFRRIVASAAAAALLTIYLSPITTASPSAPTIIAIATGAYHTCALTAVGGVKCWGDNFAGDLGDGTTTISTTTPVDVLGLAKGVTAIAAGQAHTCAVTSAGGVKCWGWNDSGQLGNGTTTDSSVPVDVSGLAKGVTAIVANWNHTCAITVEGGVKCWGWNEYGQLGNGTTTDSSVPVDVTGLRSRVTAVATGMWHTCALTVEGGVKCWGHNEYGVLGNGTTTDSLIPVDVSGLASGVTAIAAGQWMHACAVTRAGGVKCWGSNYYGELGTGTTTDSLIPVDVSGLTSGVTAIAAGFLHTCAETTAGGVKCWGDNDYGALGDGTTTDRHTPVDVVGLASGVASVVAGDVHTCVLTAAGGVKCWGRIVEGPEGTALATDSNVPVDVAFASAQTPTPTPSSSGSWTATISGAGISGTASLTVPATGWATAAFSLYHLKKGVSVTARIIAGAACDASVTTIKTLPGYTTTIGGTWRQQWVFDGTGLVKLRSATRSGAPLWFDVTVGGSRACTRLVPEA